MEQKKLIFSSILFASVFSILYLTLHQNTFGNDLQSTFENDSMLRNELWEQMNEWIFFKRSSAYYIIEDNLFKIYLISKDNFKLNVDITLKGDTVDKWSKKFTIHNLAYEQKEVRLNYNLNMLSFKFNLLEYFNFEDYDEVLKRGNFNLTAYFSQTGNLNYRTQYPINVNIKYIKSKNGSSKKNGSIICSKCLYFKNNDDYKYLLWWLELNKQIGYTKVIFCNQSIPDTKGFRHLFETYKDFIELKQFRSIPNFSDSNKKISPFQHNFLTDYFQLSPSQEVYDWNVDGYDVLHTNECFLENADKYEHVTVVDIDETIMPRINSKFKKKSDTFEYVKQLNTDSLRESIAIKKEMSSLSNTCSSRDQNKIIDSYLSSIADKTNFHFSMAYYLKDVTVKMIFNAFEAYFKSNSSNSLRQAIEVIDITPKSKFHNPYNYTFIIKNQDELIYAKNLLFIYRHFIEKFENKYTKQLSGLSEQFHRYFYISGPTTGWLCGKSIWHTDKTSEYSVHYGVVASEPRWFNFDEGHNAHFRQSYPFNAKNISITEFSLDFNYLNCFYEPMIRILSNVSIF